MAEGERGVGMAAESGWGIGAVVENDGCSGGVDSSIAEGPPTFWPFAA